MNSANIMLAEAKVLWLSSAVRRLSPVGRESKRLHGICLTATLVDNYSVAAAARWAKIEVCLREKLAKTKRSPIASTTMSV